MALRTKTKIDPDAIYVALDGFGTQQSAYKQGAKLRGSHPDVIAFPHLWILDGASDGEAAAARYALRGPDPVVEPAPPPVPPRIAGSTPIDELVQCVTGILSSPAGTCSIGRVLHKDDKLVREVPSAFRSLVDQLELA